MNWSKLASRIALSLSAIAFGIHASIITTRHYGAVSLDVPKLQYSQHSSYPLDFNDLEALDEYLTRSAIETRRQLLKAGTWPDKPVEHKDLELMAAKAFPYIAGELRISKVNMPEISIRPEWSQQFSGYYSSRTNEVVLESYQSLSQSKLSLTHELIHAQASSLPLQKSLLAPYTHWLTKYPAYDETFVELASLEVLANQALNGDLVAKYSLLSHLHKSVEWQLWAAQGNSPSKITHEYYLAPLQAIRNSISGPDQQRGITLDALKHFLYIDTRIMMRDTA